MALPMCAMVLSVTRLVMAPECGDSMSDLLAASCERLVNEDRQPPLRVLASVGTFRCENRMVRFRVMRAKSPNDPKLSDRRSGRGTCMAGGKAAVEAGAVTAEPVRCSAWLGVAGIGVERTSNEVNGNSH